jgi:hypothetical protein
MRDNEVQSEPVIAKFKEGAVLFGAMRLYYKDATKGAHA